MATAVKYLLLVFVFTLAECKSVSQNASGEGEASRPFISCKACQDADIDPLGNMYMITASNDLVKYSRAGKELYRYSNRFLGPLQSFDVLNPQKVLLYFRDFQMVVLLDNTLSELEQIAIGEWGYANVTAVAMSNDNRLWVFDEIESELLKLDRQGNKILQSDPLNLILSPGFSPEWILEKDNTVIVHDLNKGVLLFDQFGQFEEDTRIRTQSRIAVQDDMLYFHENATLHIYHVKTKHLSKTPFERKGVNIKKILFDRDYCYYLTPEGLNREPLQ